MIEFRGQLVERSGVRLAVALTQDAIDSGRVTEQAGPHASRSRLQILPLLEAIGTNSFEALVGDARRGEEQDRAKERIFSFRDDSGQWDPEGDTTNWPHPTGQNGPQPSRIWPGTNRNFPRVTHIWATGRPDPGRTGVPAFAILQNPLTLPDPF